MTDGGGANCGTGPSSGVNRPIRSGKIPIPALARVSHAMKHLKHLGRGWVYRGRAQEELGLLLLRPSHGGQKPHQLYLHEHPSRKKESKKDVVENRHATLGRGSRSEHHWRSDGSSSGCSTTCRNPPSYPHSQYGTAPSRRGRQTCHPQGPRASNTSC